jgi:hypothetical protein
MGLFNKHIIDVDFKVYRSGFFNINLLSFQYMNTSSRLSSFTIHILGLRICFIKLKNGIATS